MGGTNIWSITKFAQRTSSISRKARNQYLFYFSAFFGSAGILLLGFCTPQIFPQFCLPLYEFQFCARFFGIPFSFWRKYFDAPVGGNGNGNSRSFPYLQELKRLLVGAWPRDPSSATMRPACQITI